ncbi:MAG: nuclear transport factor 2 family protein [Acidobacteriota bacterium]|nr:nuclear transport factor 2 family protein [Acidobacteriota bacterium]
METTRKLVPALVAALTLLIVASNASAQQSQARLRDAIVQANQKFMAAFARGDGVALASLYSQSAQVLQPNGNIVSGTHGIQAFWQGAIDSGLKQVKLETVEVEGMGSMAAEVGTYTMRRGSGEVVDSGKYIVLWKREKGKWRLHRDIWNSNTPLLSQ